MFRLLDAILFAFERLRLHRVLVMWALVGLSVATTLTMSLSLYVDAVYSGVLSSRLDDPPYGYRFRYVGSWDGPLTQADVVSATAALEAEFQTQIDLPTAHQLRYVRGGTWNTRTEDNQALGVLGLGSLVGVENLITITAGEWPPQTPRDPDAPIPVLARDDMLYTLGIQPGDILTAQRAGGQPRTFEVVALWQALNPRDTAWVFQPSYFDDVLLVAEADLWAANEGIAEPVEEVAWYTIFDGAAVQTADVGGLIEASIAVERRLQNALPGVRVDLSPQEELTAFNEEVQQLNQQLLVMVLPVGGMVFYFVSVVAGLLVSRQQQEDVTLRSRGMSRRAVLRTHVLMWLMLAGAALAVGIAAAPLVVQLVGRTSSFLRFDMDTAPLTVIFTGRVLLIGAATSLIATSSGLFLAWRTSSQNINTFKRDVARARRAWWQRIYLDVMLLIPAFYVLYSLQEQGGLETEAENPFSDPITFLGPTLFALGLTLLFLRIWPLLLKIGAGVMGYTRNIALLMSLRELTRSIGRYRGTLLMMCFTLSLTGYMASMASTLDRSLEDTVYYAVGADGVLYTAADAQTEENELAEGEQGPTQTLTGYNTLPPDDLFTIEGVYQVSRVGRYPARIVQSSRRIEGVVLGIDRATIAGTFRGRDDFADAPMPDMFNLLAGQRDGVLLSRSTAEANNFVVGQVIEMEFQALGEWHTSRVPIIGLLDYFPTLDPNAGMFLITNIDPLFEAVGTQLPHDFWLGLTPGTNLDNVVAEARTLGYPVLEWEDPQTQLQSARALPARRGVLGFLSVGFVASIALTLVIAVIQTTASFRAQAVQLGALRAMGLSGGAVGGYLLFLQGIASISGVLGGTVIGLLTTLLYLPLLDFSTGLPPYLIRVAWGEIAAVYAIFAGVLFFVTLLTTLLLGRQSVTTLVKLGDV